MRSMERLIPYKSLAIAGLALGSLSLLGCTNYEGEGNDFVVRATVEDATWQSVWARVYQVDQADGRAADDSWFGVTGNDEEFHDNCDCDTSGFFTDRMKVGDVYQDGEVISPEELALGTCVEFQGKIRDDQDPKTYHERPVYEVATVVPCG